MVSEEARKMAMKAEQYYEARLREQLEKTHWGWFVAIEPESWDYFLSRRTGEASAAARLAHPDRLHHLMRVGSPVPVEIGGISG